MIVIVGSTGTIGSALKRRYANLHGLDSVLTLGRDQEDDAYVNMCDIESYSSLDLSYVTQHIDNTGLDALVLCHGINPRNGIKSAATVTSDQQLFECESKQIASDAIEMLQANIVSSMMIVRQMQHLIKSSGSVVMLGSIASKKGSFDPAYAASKSAMVGLMHSLAAAYPNIRFNIVSPGLISDSRVHRMMLSTVGNDYVEMTHASRMHGSKLINIDDVVSTIMMIIENRGIASTEICIDGGMRI